MKPDFELLVERHSAEIYASVWRLLRETHDAEDCLGEAFLRAFRSYARVWAGTNYRAWQYKIATNTARSHWKRRKRNKNRPVESEPGVLSSVLNSATAL